MLKLELPMRGLAVAGGVILSLWLLTQVWPVVLLVVTALIFMAALLPYVRWLGDRGLPRTPAALVLLLGLLAVFGGLLALVVPAMLDEFDSLRTNLPANARDLEDLASNFGIDIQLEERARDIDWAGLVSGRAAVNIGQQVILLLASIVTVTAMTVYLLIDTPRMATFVYQFVPPGNEPKVEHLLSSLGRVVGGYVRGQVITSAIIGIFTYIVCVAAGVPNAVAFAALAAFADILPLVGVILATVPPTIAAFQESPAQAAVVLGLLLAYQQFEDRILVPRVYSRTLNLPPLIVLIAVLVGGELLGIAGILLALPAAAAARVVLDYFHDPLRGPGLGTLPEAPAGDATPSTERTLTNG